MDHHGPWILLLLTGFVLLARPLSRLLPVIADPPAGARLSGRRLWALLIGPAVLTPLILRVVPTHFLPVLVADYVAAHFAFYGLLTAGGLLLVRTRQSAGAPVRGAALIGAALAAMLYAVVGLGAIIDAWIASFVTAPGRMPIILAMLAGALRSSGGRRRGGRRAAFVSGASAW